MTVKVNGDAREVPEGTSLRALVEQFNFKPEKVALELNRRLVRAEKYDTPLKEGDEVIVGGQMKLRNGAVITINNTVLPTSDPAPALPTDQ